MKDTRPGEWLWEEWDGEGYETDSDCPVIYVTYEHVDLGEEVVRRALASSMQRDGVAYSLANGFQMLESAIISHGFVGFVEEEKYLAITDEEGYTPEGDLATNISMATWVECPD